jgi:hypothetical protein
MNKQDMTVRLIEADFPLRKVSEESVREKNIRHGHISTLHIWWARRPLAASRTTALAALLPDDPRRREELLALVRDIAPWEAVSNGNAPQIEKARQLIREAFGGRAPRVLDCFAGGGSIPLEALRLGCETYALDYNPVAVLILKAVLEFPQRFGRSDQVKTVPLPPVLQEQPQTDQRLLDVESSAPRALCSKRSPLGEPGSWRRRARSWSSSTRRMLTAPSPSATSGRARSPARTPPAAPKSPSCARPGWPKKKIAKSPSSSSRTGEHGAWRSKSSGQMGSP